MLDGQICTDTVDIQRDDDNEINRIGLVIIPRLNFTCNGRITNIMAKMRRRESDSFPYFHIWHPVSLSSNIYNKTYELLLQSDNVIELTDTRVIISITLTGDARIEVMSGDVVGFYHLLRRRNQILTIRTDGYEQYEFDVSSNVTSVDLSNYDAIDNQMQPLIQFTIGQQKY